MSKMRLRGFENASGQRHVSEDDRYLYRREEPRFRLVIIGTGTMGQEHMRVAALLGRARIHGIYDTQSLSMDTAEANFLSLQSQPLVRYNDLSSACNDPAADALLICTPNHTHFDVLRTAMQSNKPIFLEKPMATELQDAAEIVRANEAYESFIQIGLQYRYKPQYLEAFREALDNRALGQIKTVSVSEYRPPFLDKVDQWNKFARLSGGTLVEKCCHYFDLINLLAEARPQRVYASGGQAVNFVDFERNGVKSDIDDHAFVAIDYANGVRASFTLNMFCPDFAEELIVVGDAGRLKAEEYHDIHRSGSGNASLTIKLGENGLSKTSDLTYPRAIEQSGHHGSTYFEHIALMDRLEGKEVDSATPRQGMWAMVVASAAQQSLALGRPIDVDRFILDHDLASLLNR
ncbi:MAG TPA: gfo/Idh/MocA family oxidoreductase [Gammaproteobacteria bacterium]|jgi:predicted dehydrogenase|nr:oxidoreductase [Gammaproteobacteria bacterium]HBX01272.1 gfo/Idh/MocA family oxidoreductase [Gammaproteobacteria bacterium]|tara:strand:+ start:5230 stop:6444 length:1215 start_codon:yes stop_codon:yes gene_type:complete